jgi:hypothetical protein
MYMDNTIFLNEFTTSSLKQILLNFLTIILKNCNLQERQTPFYDKHLQKIIVI